MLISLYIYTCTYIDIFVIDINMLPKGIFVQGFDPRFAFLNILVLWFLLCLYLPSPKRFSFKSFGSSNVYTLLLNSHF